MKLNIFYKYSPIILFFLLAPLFSFGQSLPAGNLLDLTISPKNPEPFQLVKAKLTSLSYDLDRSQITWLINGVAKKTDSGLTEFTFIAGKSGQLTSLRADILTHNFDKQSASLSFIPSVVDLLFESISYTPPFYKGKALNPNQGRVIVVAVPELVATNGQKISNSNIVYSWKKDGKVEQGASGLGKNTLTFNGTVPIRDAVIEVTATSYGGSLSAYKKITIDNIKSPKIIFYENNPIYGIMMNRAISSNVKMVSDEFSVLAMPYFFTIKEQQSPDLEYVWSLDGRKISNQTPINSFTTRINTSGIGSAQIRLKLNNISRIFQFTDNNYALNFTKQ